MQCMYQQLSKATSVAEIVQLTRDYLATWSVDELERLPDSCRPGRVRTAEDIEEWADRLHAESARTTMYLDDERKLDRITSHFLIASVRMRQIEGAFRMTLAA